MAGNKSHINVRPARPSDNDEVMAIAPNLFGGADYLPNTFHSYFSDPRAHPYVADVDGKVVTFGNYYVMDDGHTAVSSGGRTLALYQGTGINAQIMEASLHAATYRYPHLQREARVVVDDDFYDKYRTPGADPKAFKIVTEQYFIQYLTTKRKILNLLKYLETSPNISNTQLNTAYIEDLKVKTALPDKLLQSTGLLPSTSIITPRSYLPLRVYKENLTEICMTTDVVSSMDQQGENCHGISFSLLSNFKIGPSITTFYYVKSVEDMFHHLKLQLQQKRDEFEGEGRAILELAFPLELSLKDTKAVLFPYLGNNDLYDSTPRETIMVLERPLKLTASKL